MVLRYTLPNGSRIMGPPFTEEEEQDLYRRMDGGPWTVLRTAKTPPQSAGSGAAATNRQSRATTPPTPAAAARPEDPQSE
jgi:hypothetical protein